jgi:hypothetical protein
MNVLEAFMVICAMALAVLVAIGLHTFQMWLERERPSMTR